MSMKLLIFLLGSVLICRTYSLSDRCFEKVEECHTTNYQEYVDCVRKRHKRSIECDTPCESDNCINTCNECDCSSCSYSNCQGSCDSCCSTCCSNYNVCNNNHCCHKTCHAQCRSSSCRSSCRKNCYERIKNLDEKTAASTNITTYNENKPNITTIIHLNNVINNTNIIDIPISINNTNQHNITLLERGGSGFITSNQNNCCIVISPRQCVPQNEYPFFRCFHYRSKQCGDYCTAPIVHKEQKEICQTTFPGSAPNCRQSVIYIPQPQPRCTYQSTWPYVSCGVSKSASCAGCYSHYTDSNAQNYVNCPSACYDDGFGTGPYYRQGPIYRPTYTHVPCFSCFGYGGYGGFGGFGGYGSPSQEYPSFGGFPGYSPYGGYPPLSPGLGNDFASQGTWTPGIENGFANFDNNTGSNLEPLISVGPNLLSNPLIADPFRAAREIEIEVDYEPKSDVQAEVKIRKHDKSGTKEGASTDEAKSTSLSTNSTEATSPRSKLS